MFNQKTVVVLVGACFLVDAIFGLITGHVFFVDKGDHGGLLDRATKPFFYWLLECALIAVGVWMVFFHHPD